MTFTVSPWWVWAGCSLALFGAWFVGSRVWRWTWDGIWRLVYWLRWDRVTPLLEEEDNLEELPPERSRKELGFTGEPDIHCNYCTDGCVRCDPRKQDEYRWSPALERRAPKWEAEARGHYLSMGLDFPSGLMARVRELTP